MSTAESTPKTDETPIARIAPDNDSRVEILRDGTLAADGCCEWLPEGS